MGRRSTGTRSTHVHVCLLTLVVLQLTSTAVSQRKQSSLHDDTTCTLHGGLQS